VALDRQSIERKDFPIGRRGYDPGAVDAHLAMLADEIEDLTRSSHRRSETLAAAASERVRTIIDAAETSAAQILRQAEREAQEIRAEATSQARATREQANLQGRDYIGRVSESAAAMLKRLEAMESELGSLIDALKTGGNRLSADLQLLGGTLEEARDAIVPRQFAPETASAPPGGDAPAAARPQGNGVSGAPGPRPDGDGPREAPRARSAGGRAGSPPPTRRARPRGGAAQGPTKSAAPDPAAEAPERESESAKLHGDALEPAARGGGRGGATEPARTEDDDGARFVALNMALSGRSREETERYLAENFRVRDQQGLLDEVYANVGA
jgi:DivIVA domain-containing protein